MRILKLLAILLLGTGLSLAAARQVRQVAMVYIPGNPGYQDVTFSGTNLVIAHSGAGTVDIFDSAKRRLLTQIKIDQPKGIAVDEHGGKVYVANAANKTIAVISNRSWKVERAIPLKLQPGPLALSAEGSVLFIGNDQDQSISTLDLATKKQQTQALGGHPSSLIYDSTHNLIFVSLEDQHQIAILDFSLKVLKRYSLAALQPSALVLDAQSRRLYVAVRYAVLALNADDGTEITRLAAPAGVDSLSLDSANGKLYASSNDELNVINISGSKPIAEDQFPLKAHGHGLALDRGRNLLYIPSGNDARSLVLILRPLHGGMGLQSGNPQASIQ